MTYTFERLSPTGLAVIERPSMIYSGFPMGTTPAQFTAELGGAFNFEIDLSDYPAGCAVRAVHVDLRIGEVFNGNVNGNWLDRDQTGNLGYLYPWQVKKASHSSWVTCGNLRSFDLVAPGGGQVLSEVCRRGHINVKAEIDESATYQFRLGDTASGLGWAARYDSLSLGALSFLIRIEVI